MANRTTKTGTNEIPLWVLVDHIMRVFSRDGKIINKRLAEYLIQSILSDPKSDFARSTDAFTQEKLPLLVAACEDKFKKESFLIATADLQLFLEHELPTRESFFSNMKRELDSQHHMLLNDILTSVVNTTWDLGQLNKKVIAYVVRRSGLGDVKNSGVLKDCAGNASRPVILRLLGIIQVVTANIKRWLDFYAAALSSVWPEGTMNKFAYFSRERKVAELQDYVLLSSGVRLFNKEKQQGGVGIEDVPQVLADNLTKLQNSCLAELARITLETKALTDVIAGVLQGGLPDYLTEVDSLKDALIFLHQYAANLDILKNEISESRIIAERALLSFQSTIRDLQENCRNERVIAANVVFPLFVSLAKDWTVLEHERKRVDFLDNIFAHTQQKLTEWEHLNERLKPCHSRLNTVQQPSTEVIRKEQLQNRSIRLLQKETTSQYDQVPIALKGACLVTLVEDDGFFVPGNKQIGVVQYNEKYISFRSVDAAMRFCENPSRYFSAVSDCIKRRPVLEKLLGLSVRRNSANGYEELARLSSGAVVKVDAGIQSELHPVASHFDPNYDWNVWNIRKKAYNLYNTTQASTHSSQTYFSRYRKECASQTIMAPKNVEVQTKIESSTSGVNHLQYFAGLRGGPDAFNKIRFKQIDLSSNKQEQV